MQSTTSQLTASPPGSSAPTSLAARRPGPDPDRATWRETFGETAAIFDAPAFFGPPVSFVLGPWLLLVLLLMGPFALLVTLVLVLALAAVLLAAIVAVIASPYLLIRHLHSRGWAHATPLAALHVFRNHRAGSRRLVSPQPKGVS